MSREVRRVPKDWDPPKKYGSRNELQPHFDMTFSEAVRKFGGCKISE